MADAETFIRDFHTKNQASLERHLVNLRAAIAKESLETLDFVRLAMKDAIEAVVEEVNRGMDFDVTRLMRLRDDGAATHLLSWPPDDLVSGATLPLDGDSVTARVQRSGRPARHRAR